MFGFRSIMMLALLGLLVACGEDTPDPTPLPLATQTPMIVTATPDVITATPTAQATPTLAAQALSTAVPPPTLVNCTVRSDWSAYTVVAGDTLGVIATNTNATIQQLVTANCLTNPDAIFVGQSLRVPTLPAVDNGAGQNGGNGNNNGGTGDDPGSGNGNAGDDDADDNEANVPRFQTSLRAQPVIDAADGSLVTLQDTIALDIGVVADADAVRFFVSPTGVDDTSPINFATDNDPFDGTPVTYTFAAFDQGETLFFWAVAENQFGNVRSAVLPITYDPDLQTGSGAPGITPSLGFDGSIYTLQWGQPVTVTWGNAPTSASRVEFYLADSDGTRRLIGSDTNPANGASIAWTVPQWVLGQISATAIIPGASSRTSAPVNVYSEGDEDTRPAD
ncbi:MAG: LysM peptidoglycan-binding domain-containing protein [Anaerolineales bacterium]